MWPHATNTFYYCRCYLVATRAPILCPGSGHANNQTLQRTQKKIKSNKLILEMTNISLNPLTMILISEDLWGISFVLQPSDRFTAWEIGPDNLFLKRETFLPTHWWQTRQSPGPCHHIDVTLMLSSRTHLKEIKATEATKDINRLSEIIKPLH